ncbi:Fungal-trans domain-containing protein [Mycena venus]|uniref:Fungal-trans domain-containing protein n=1 Tax=Mycena venus TaxID=2733690 RepID=A0A8H6XAN2_9AGAR|nr:Fungal-trans domain-containing protein [Mycena venus]
MTSDGDSTPEQDLTRKIRCEGSKVPGGRCSNCSAFNSDCTYAQPPKKRGRKYRDTIVEELKRENFELRAENASLKTQLQSLSLCSICRQPLHVLPAQGSDNPSASRRSTSTSESTSSDPEESIGDQESTVNELTARFNEISLDAMDVTYLGPASSFALAGNVFAMKEKYLGRPLPTQSGRSLFWGWEKEAYDQKPRYVFPPSDLIIPLLDLYFTSVHPTLPILHRPSFERSVSEGLHLKDPDFGGTLLSVLALASRYSNDPRVLVDGDVSSLSSGWRFATQVRILPTLSQPTIYQVQMCYLLAIFMLGTSVPQVSWLYLVMELVSVTFSIAASTEDSPGAAKQALNTSYGSEHSGLLLFWNGNSAFVWGGPRVCILKSTYEVEPPLEVDDEYWDRGFIQPLDKPSQLSYFKYHLRLFEVLGDVMRRLYGSKKAKLVMGWDGPQWEQRTVAEFDSIMNNFLESIPPHLRWDPENPPQGTFFDQSAILHMAYNYTLISIHLPYIQMASVLGAPSLSICASAARAIITTADIWLRKLQRVPLPSILDPVFVSTVILILNSLRTKRTALPMEKDWYQVARAMEIFKFAESRLQPAGRVWDLLRELSTLEAVPFEYPPNHEPHSDGSGPSFSGIPESPALDVPEEYHPQPCQSFDVWNRPLPSDQTSTLRPGMTIEQLLADADSLDAMNSILDDQLMSMLMAPSADVANMDQWDTYVEHSNAYGTDAIWPNGFGAQQ